MVSQHHKNQVELNEEKEGADSHVLKISHLPDDQTPSLEVGEGSTLYLQHLKSLLCLFFLLAVLNGPVLLVFGINDNQEQPEGFLTYFSHFSLANIGESSRECAHKSLKINRYSSSCPCSGENCQGVENAQDVKGLNRLILNCSNGAKISKITDFGFLKPQDSTQNPSIDPKTLCLA